MLKRIFAMLLSVLMVAGLVPASVFATETIAEETAELATTEVTGVLSLGSQTISVYKDEFVQYAFTAPVTDVYRFTATNEGGNSDCFLRNNTFNVQEQFNDGNGDDFSFTWVIDAGDTVYLDINSTVDGSAEIEAVQEHSWYSVDDPPATCSTDGLRTSTCEYCGESYEEVVPASHTYENGYCTQCGEGLSGTCGDNVTWRIDNGVLTLSGSGETYYYSDPEETPWYAIREDIINITIEDGIETIGKNLFAGLSKLESVNIPDSVWDIRESAFEYCSSLRYVYINADIADSAFAHCSSLADIDFGENCTAVGSYAFDYCTSLTSVSLPVNVPPWNYGYAIFRNCTSLQVASFPENFAMIPEEMFRGCTSLTNADVGCGLYSIGWNAFENCTSLEFFFVPSSCASIDEEAFKNSGLKDIIFSGSFTNIGENAFAGVTATAFYPSEDCAGEWTDDEKVNYGGTITWKPYNFATFASGTCGENVTWRIDNAGRIFIEGTGPMYDYSGDGVDTPWYEYKDQITAFKVAEGVTHIGANAFTCCRKYLFKGEIASTVKSIGFGAFYKCEDFGILVPSTVETIGEFAFVGTAFCQWEPDYAYGECGVEEGSVKWEYTKSDWTLRISGKGDMIAYANDYPIWNIFSFPINSIVIEEGVTSVGAWAFNYLTGSTTVILPYSLEKICDGAFIGCDTLYVKFSGPAPVIAEDAFYRSMDAHLIYPNKESGYDSLLANTYGAYKTTWVPLEQTEAPAVKASNVASSGKIKLTWDAVEGAVSYKIYRANSKTGTYSLMKTQTGTSYVNSTSKAGNYYYYYVVAVNEDGMFSPRSNIVGRRADCAQPVVTLSNVESSGKIKVSWDSVTGAVKYQVWRATTKNGTYTCKTTVTGTSWTDTNTTAGKTYYYKVKAINSNSGANSVYSAVKSRMCDLKRPTVTLSNVASTGKVKVSWTSVTGATKYQVWRATSKNGEYTRQTTVTGTSWTDTSTVAGKTYYYKVRAVHSNTNANSALTSWKSRMCDLKRPTVSITRSSGKPKVSWAGITGATKYRIYRSTSKNGTYSLVQTTTAKYWKDSTAVKGKTYYYKVVAVHSKSGANSAESTVKYIKCTK